MSYFICPVCGNKQATDEKGGQRRFFKDHLAMYHRVEVLQNYAILFDWNIPIYDQLDRVIDETVLIMI